MRTDSVPTLQCPSRTVTGTTTEVNSNPNQSRLLEGLATFEGQTSINGALSLLPDSGGTHCGRISGSPAHRKGTGHDSGSQVIIYNSQDKHKGCFYYPFGLMCARVAELHAI